SEGESEPNVRPRSPRLLRLYALQRVWSETYRVGLEECFDSFDELARRKRAAEVDVDAGCERRLDLRRLVVLAEQDDARVLETLVESDPARELDAVSAAESRVDHGHRGPTGADGLPGVVEAARLEQDVVLGFQGGPHHAPEAPVIASDEDGQLG